MKKPIQSCLALVLLLFVGCNQQLIRDAKTSITESTMSQPETKKALVVPKIEFDSSEAQKFALNKLPDYMKLVHFQVENKQINKDNDRSYVRFNFAASLEYEQDIFLPHQSLSFYNYLKRLGWEKPDYAPLKVPYYMLTKIASGKQATKLAGSFVLEKINGQYSYSQMRIEEEPAWGRPLAAYSNKYIYHDSDYARSVVKKYLDQQTVEQNYLATLEEAVAPGSIYEGTIIHAGRSSQRVRLSMTKMDPRYKIVDAKLTFLDQPEPTLYFKGSYNPSLRNKVTLNNINLSISGYEVLTYPKDDVHRGILKHVEEGTYCGIRAENDELYGEMVDFTLQLKKVR
jgi:hypothetical protein